MPTLTERGFRLPAETDPHERCVIAWPTMRRVGFWRGHLGAARDTYAVIARTINEYEPVLVVADEGEGRAAEQWMQGEVEVVELPIDDSWVRDNGPLVVRNDAGDRCVVDFGFNAWGSKLEPWDRDAGLGTALAEHLGLPRVAVPMILEGGSVIVDGAGTLVATESCLLHPNRNPDLSRADIETVLRDHLGVDRVVWLASGLHDDVGTDGHVDNVVCFLEPGRVLLQTTTDLDDPDHAASAASRAVLEAAGIEVVEIDTLPHVDCFDELVEVPYVNLYPGNGAVFVPVAGAAADRAVLRDLEACFPGRAVVPVPGRVLAYGGGGVHCITQPVPAGAPDPVASAR